MTERGFHVGDGGLLNRKGGLNGVNDILLLDGDLMELMDGVVDGCCLKLVKGLIKLLGHDERGGGGKVP